MPHERASSPFLAMAVLLAAAGCAAAPPAPPAPEGGVPAPRPPEVAAAAPVAPHMAGRRAVEAVPMPNAFAAALAAGTRTTTGRPGTRYWQQEADYRIDAELDPATSTLRGQEVITYRNRSPFALEELVLHLYQNLFSQGVMRNRNVPITGGMTVERVAVAGREAAPETPPEGAASYTIDGTVMRIALAEPLAPGARISLEVDWRFRVPPAGAPRMGRIGTGLYTIAQWYPQVATFDDLYGWHDSPYLGDGEFYLEYGDFDVSITVPEGWIVGATGALENPDEVLPPPVRQRLAEAARTDDVVHVITEDDFGPGNATERAPEGQLTWRFRARDVRDFAFATSDRYLWDATRAVVRDADGNGRPEVVAVNALYRPEAADWREAARFARHAVRFHSERWLPYMYPQITVAEGPVGGMEYPMIVFVRSFGQAETTYRVTDHEVAHEWNAMMVGPNETAHAWQDEGINTYMENVSAAEFLGRPEAVTFGGDLDRYLALAGTDAEVPIMRHTDLYGPGPQRVTATYSKPAVVLRALETVVGRDVVQRAIAEYFRRWLMKHPHPLDFFNTVEDLAGRDLDWFWHPWFYETAVLDQAVIVVEEVGKAIESPDIRYRIDLEDRGGIPMTVPLRLTLRDGSTRELLLPADTWLDGDRAHHEFVVVPSPLERVEIDPDLRLPDVDRANNVWVAGGR